MSRHGLWRFHKAARAAGVRWFDEEELERNRYRINRHICPLGYSGRPSSEYTDTKVIERCALRYMSMHKLPMRVRIYNALCVRIAQRAKFYPQSVKAATIPGAVRCNPPMRNLGYALVAAWTDDDVRERAERIALVRAQRDEEKRHQINLIWASISDAKNDLWCINNAIRNAQRAIKERHA